jgi:hypothetical protein
VLLPGAASAQTPDPNLIREAEAIRTHIARSRSALRDYTWVERTEVMVKGKLQASTEFLCRHDGSGELTKSPTNSENKTQENAIATSNRPRVRKKADMQDYIGRAVTMTNRYLPPDPDQITYLLEHGKASLSPAASGKAEIRFRDYFQDGDSMVFTYDVASKALLRATVASTLGGPKDPVTMNSVFETLPDGVTHLATATLDAKAKKVQVLTKNTNYQKGVN